MFSYYLKCKKNAECKKPKIEKVKKERILLLSNSMVGAIKNSEIYQGTRTH